MRNLLYAQSGGPTAVINVTAAAVIETVRREAAPSIKLFAARDGILGLLEEDLLDTTSLTATELEALRVTPAAAFGACRYRVDLGERELTRVVAVLAAHEIDTFLYNGGGGSAATCLAIAAGARRLGYPLRAIHVPKTVDNDLPLTDCCPGFGSVAKYVATSVRGASLDVASMARTSTRVFVLEVMGRDAGWIAAAGALASNMELPLSVVLVLPELPFDSASVVTAVDRQLASHGYCTVVLSEGCKDAQGEYLARQGVADALGHVHLGGAAPRLARTIAQRLAVKVHWAVADYLQRSARHLASAVDVAQAEAVGIHAVRLALAGADARMPVIVRLADDPYRWELGDVALEAVVAAGERRLPAEFLGSTPFTVSEACTRYLAPLIAGEASPPFANGLPCYRLLRAVPVPRRLPPLARSV